MLDVIKVQIHFIKCFVCFDLIDRLLFHRLSIKFLLNKETIELEIKNKNFVSVIDKTIVRRKASIMGIVFLLMDHRVSRYI